MYQCRYEKLIVLTNALTKRKILIKNNISPPHENGERDSRRITMSVTAAIIPNESSWGGRGAVGREGGCLGFLVYLFAAAGPVRSNRGLQGMKRGTRGPSTAGSLRVHMWCTARAKLVSSSQ
jgi:hypothetical protein